MNLVHDAGFMMIGENMTISIIQRPTVPLWTQTIQFNLQCNLFLFSYWIEHILNKRMKKGEVVKIMSSPKWLPAKTHHYL